MSRRIRNTAVLAKIESTYGTDPTPTGGSNAILVSSAVFPDITANNVDRGLLRPYLGSSEQLVGSRYVDIAFDVELQSSGGTFTTTATVPAYGPLLRACGLAETATNGASQSRVEYLPVSGSYESVTIYYYLDGVLRKATGCRGNVVFKLGAGGRPLMSFAFKGLDGGISEASLPSTTLTGWITPKVVTDPNSGDVTLGCTYAAGGGTSVPALSGGTAYPSLGIEVDLGNRVEYVDLLGGQEADITDRQTVAKISLDVTAAQEVTLEGIVTANTLQAIGFTHGAANGARILLHAPAAQLINPKTEDQKGRAMKGYSLRLTPSSGNDEFRLVVA